MLTIIAQMRLQSVRGGSVARLSDHISVSLRTQFIKIDQHFFPSFFSSHFSTFTRALSTLIQTVAPLLNSSSLVSLFRSQSILLSADLWEGWVDHLLFAESSEKRDWMAAREGVRHGWKKGMMCVKRSCNYDGSKLRVDMRRCDMLPLKGPGMNHSTGYMLNRENQVMVYFLYDNNYVIINYVYNNYYNVIIMQC